MTAKLHVYQGHCKHYGNVRGELVCDKGVDVRAHVGGPDYGWMARIPCVTSKLSKEQVTCGLRELPTADELAAGLAGMDRLLRAVVNGCCPDCGSALRLRETDEVQLRVCPNGCVSMRGCKRPGAYPSEEA